jgi:PiT family inorganic phosphate transporter
VTTLTIVAALAFAVTMGMADAGNASANLVASHGGRVRVVLALAFFTHLAGALLSGTAVASTVLGAIHVPRSELATVLAAGTLAALGLLVLATRRGLPVSAGLALVAGLAGAAWAANGTDGIVWGGMHGVRPYGVLGAALAMVVAPLLGIAAAATARALAGVVLHRASVRVMRPIGGLLWVSSGVVGFADGSNDGQKAMAVVVGALVARGSLTGGGIPMWVRFAVGFTLALGTLLGARVLRTVSRRLYATRGLDAAMAESSSAIVIIASSLVGAPVSTTAVVTSGVVGVGVVQHPRHIHWSVVRRIAIVWAVSFPASIAAGALTYLVLDAVAH